MSMDRPILFSAPMVRAILSGTKVQTRRLLRDQNPIDLGANMYGAHLSRRPVFDKVAKAVIGHRLRVVCCPYGEPCDRLWVRETWAPDGDGGYLYRADCTLGTSGVTAESCEADAFEADRRRGERWARWRSSIHMPRWASRITLEITGVRVERLHDISRGDAMSEGCPFPNMAQGDDPRQWYAELWDQINGPGAWDANPLVWVIGFKRAPAA